MIVYICSVDKNHKPFIDALRGIAVIAIILFHFNFSFFSGGFIGVDIFFVISGFVVTTKIIGSVSNKTFSFGDFYANRIRRIFPALFVLSFFVILFELIFFDYAKFKLAGESISAISVFLSNILFWYKSGYFDKINLENPFLHIWSLSIEEQFYFLLPVILIVFLKRNEKKISMFLVLLLFISFLLFCIGTFTSPNATFYFLPTRMWEFLMGAVLSTWFLQKKYTTRNLNVLGIAGFIMLFFSIYLNYIKSLSVSGTIFLSVISVSLLIISGLGDTSFTNKILQNRVLIFIGKISYSLYLWHWPVYCFVRYIVNKELNGWLITFCFGVIFIFSYLSYVFIEEPFRKNIVWVKNKSITYLGFIFLSLLLFGTGFLIYMNNGYPNRFLENQKLQIINEHVDKLMDQYDLVTTQFQHGAELYKLGSEKEIPSFLIWGDSHALAFSTSLDIAAKKNNLAGHFLIRSGTAPFLGIEEKNDVSHEKLNFNSAVIDYIKNHTEIQTVFLSCRWSFHFSGPYINEEGGQISYIDARPEAEKKPDSILVISGIKRTVQQLLSLHRKVVIINQVPELKFEVATYYIKNRIYKMFHKFLSISPTTKEDYLIRNRSVITLFNELAGYENVTILHVDKILESGNNYVDIINNNPLYTDNNHLSIFGALYVEPLFNNYFKLAVPH